MVISSALGYSPHPPVSVSGTGTLSSPREPFLGSMGSTSYSASEDLEPPSPQRNDLAFLSYEIRLRARNRDVHHPAELPFSVPPRLNESKMVQEY